MSTFLIKERLESHFEKHINLVRVDIFKNVVYSDFNDGILSFGLDVDVNFDIYLVCRDLETQKVLSNIFNFYFDKKVLIKSSKKDINKLNLKSFVLEDQLDEIINKIFNSSYYKDKKNIFKMLKYFENNNELLEKQILSNVLLDFSDSLMHKYLSMLDTLDLIYEKKLSVVRYGDGEIKCMLTTNGCFFQEHNPLLMQELRDICEKDIENLLVCFPSLLVENKFWNDFWSNFWPRLKFYLKNKVLGDAMITRPEIFFNYGEMAVIKWKRIWQGKNVCFVTGSNSRLNSDHQLFDNIKSHNIVNGKNLNAYSQIDELLEKCLELSDIDIFLIALGPAGTALGTRLHKLGKRALDIGHLNNSFDTAFKSAPMPEKINFIRNP